MYILRALGFFRSTVLLSDFETLGPLANGAFGQFHTTARAGTPLAQCAPGPLCVTRRDLRRCTRQDVAAMHEVFKIQCDSRGHPHVMPLYAIVQGKCDVHVVERAALGGSLASHIANMGGHGQTELKGSSAGARDRGLAGLSASFVLAVSAQLASAVAHMHAKGIAHGAISPHTVHLRDSSVYRDFQRSAGWCHVLLRGFDFATRFDKRKLAKRSHPPRRTTRIVTEPDETTQKRYMAYVAAESFVEYAPAPVDVFALGVVIFELVEGRLPWPFHRDSTGHGAEGHFWRKTTKKPQFRLWLWKDVGCLLRDTVMQCLLANPSDRPTAAQVAAWLTGSAHAFLTQGPPKYNI